MTDPAIAVVGSLNVDLRLRVDRLPRSGETVHSAGLRRSVGGKGGNQAVAAARLGREVAMVGAVGTDEAGRDVLVRLRHEGVGTACVDIVEGPSGTAVVLWERPESTIVVEPGANAALDAGRVRAHRAAIARAGAVLCQLETPAGALDGVLGAATGLTLLNPAPATGRMPSAVRHFDLVVPNRHELAAMAGAAPVPGTVDEVTSLARLLDLPGDLVVTLGEDGCVVLPADAREPVHVPAVPVTDVVDSTAAGDSFCAALADAVLDGSGLADAARWAARVAAATTTRHGAMEALPHRSEITAAPPATP